MKTVKHSFPIFIISGKSPIGATGGGYSTYAYNLARILKSQGYDVYICALGDKNEEVKTPVGTLLLVRASIPILNVNVYALPGLPYYSFLFAKRVDKIIREEYAGKFIVWGIGPWGLAAPLLKLRYKGRLIHLNNYFTSVRHEWLGGVAALKISDYGIWQKIKYLFVYLTAVQLLAQFEKIVLKSAKLIITNYKSTEEILTREFKIDRNRFYRTCFYVQVYKRKSKNVPSGPIKVLPKKYIFFISRHDPRKGVNYLLRAYKILVERGYSVPLLIGGKGDMYEPNRKLAAKLGLEKNVEFLGFIDDPKQVFANASVFCFPTVEEGAGALTINEAMEMGVPIVSTACDGILEDIENNKEGLLVPVADSLALAGAIAKLLDNESLAQKMGMAARRRYEKEFSLQLMQKDIKKLLKRLL